MFISDIWFVRQKQEQPIYTQTSPSSCKEKSSTETGRSKSTSQNQHITSESKEKHWPRQTSPQRHSWDQVWLTLGPRQRFPRLPGCALIVPKVKKRRESERPEKGGKSGEVEYLWGNAKEDDVVGSSVFGCLVVACPLFLRRKESSMWYFERIFYSASFLFYFLVLVSLM